ncbi:MAG: hypothetical protein JXA57_08210 [Armatimonadetes bacterium]|nr:hypothetical protein [Armatimonadota bacterium]
MSEQERGCVDIMVQPDGRVVFRVLNDEALDLAERLAPESPEVHRRVAMRRRAREKRSHERLTDS